MSTIQPALLFGGAIILIAVLAVFGIVPEGLAQYSVIALPALAVVSYFASGGCSRSGKGCA